MTYMHQPKANQPRPVTVEENQSVRGLALVHDDVFQETVARAEDLRKREAAYRASLPSDPQEAATAALMELNAATEGWPSALDTVIQSFGALRAIYGEGGSREASPEGAATDFLSSIGAAAAQRLKEHLERIERILRGLHIPPTSETFPPCVEVERTQPPQDEDAIIHTLFQDWQRLQGMLTSGTVADGSDEMRALTRGLVELENEIGSIIPKTPRGWAERVSLAASMELEYEAEEPLTNVLHDLFSTANEVIRDPR